MPNNDKKNAIEDVYQRIFKMEWEEAKEAKEKKELKELVHIELKKLDIKSGDVIIVQLLSGNVPTDSLRKFLEQLRDVIPPSLKGIEFDIGQPMKENPKKVNIFVVPKEVSIRTLSEKEMNKEGWFRREDYRRLLRPKEG